MYLNIECPNCPGHKTCKDKMCDHCVQERAREVADESVQLAVPYYFQDYFPATAAGSAGVEENDAFLLRSINANGRINTRIQETIVPMSAKEIPGKTYTITINDTPFERVVSTDSISVDNNRNENARLLASKRTTTATAPAGQGTTVWIPNIAVPLDTDMLHISVKTDAIEEPLTYNIELPHSLSGQGPTGQKKLATFANQQLQQKGYDPRTHMALVSGNFRFVVDKKLTTLKDVEMTLAHPEPFISHTQHFKCDPQNLDQVTGLVQALEEHIQVVDASRQQRATELFNIIDAHRVKLEKTPNYTINATVNAAVHEASTMLWNEIGLSLNPGVRMHQRKMEQENKPGRDFGIQYAERIVEETLASYKEVLDGKNVIKKAWLKQKLKNIQEAVNRREKSLTSGELFDRYYKLEEKLTAALKYGTF